MDDHFGRGGSVEEAVADGGDIVVLKKLKHQSMINVYLRVVPNLM